MELWALATYSVLIEMFCVYHAERRGVADTDVVYAFVVLSRVPSLVFINLPFFHYHVFHT